MIKGRYILIILMAIALSTDAQQREKDSLMAIINKQHADIAEVNALAYLSNQLSDVDSSNKYAKLALSLSEKMEYLKGKADCYLVFAKNNFRLGNIPSGIQYALDALHIFKDINDYAGIATAYLSLESDYRDELADYRNALNFAFAGKQVAEAHNPKMYLWYAGHRFLPLFLAEIGQTYVLMNKPDSALIYTQQSLDQKELFHGGEYEFAVYLLATIQNSQGKYKDAMKNYRKALPLALQEGFAWDTLQIFSGMSTLFRNIGELDSSVHYAQIVAKGWTNESEYKNLLEALNNLAQVYKLKRNKDSALKYVELSQIFRDSVFSREKTREAQRITYNESMKQQELIASQLNYKNKAQLYTLLGSTFVLLFIAVILWRNNRQKQESKEKIERAFTELKSTQAQLIQSEKMASLGELTAGIAHEIQNPLNFVNNFSEVNKELLVEMKDEMNKGNIDDANAIANDVIDNEEKINHHGKRADAIVKGMLQHSRTSSGIKEPTNINALVNEYLSLSYHGLRAKDKTFNATLQKDFDESSGKINIIPQDIGRVLLNLYNNAFYAVTEKKKQQEGNYEPTVSVSTKKINDEIEIRVKDNGNGIPQKVIDKIFQPFFTTKPTGQGTGLGLSLSYDIVKAHGGELKVKTKDGEGSEFIVQIPIT